MYHYGFLDVKVDLDLNKIVENLWIRTKFLYQARSSLIVISDGLCNLDKVGKNTSDSVVVSKQLTINDQWYHPP